MTELRTRRVGRDRVILAAYLVLLVSIGAATLLGASILLLAGIVVIPAYLLARRVLSVSATVAMLLVLFVWITLVLFLAAGVTGLPLLPTIVLVAVATGVGSAVSVFRRGLSVEGGPDLRGLVFSGTGGIVLVGVLLGAALLPDGTPLSWAMSGDAANNVLFARTVVNDGGIGLGGGQNPVPLTATLIAMFTLPAGVWGAPGVGDQIAALAQMWSFGIVSATVLSGALALSLVRARSVVALLGVSLTALVPLGWMILSGSILLGFVNFHLTIALVLASLIAVTEARRHPLAALAIAAVATAGMLALWAPLAGVTTSAAAIIVTTQRRHLLGLRGASLLIALAALTQPVWLFFSLSLPSLLEQGSALEGVLGAVFDFPRSLLVILATAVIVLGVLWLRLTRTSDLLEVVAATVVGGGVCLGGLLWLRRGEVDLWSYYQLKFLWFMLAILAIVVIAGGFAVATVWLARPGLAALAAVTSLATVWGVSAYGQSTVPTFNRDPQALQSPLARILVGDFFSVGEGDRVFYRVDEVTSLPESTILWESTDPDEDSIMFWVVQMSAESVDDVELRTFAYYHDGQSMDDLCTLRELMGPPVTVITADPEIVQRATAACDGLGPVVLEQ